VILHCVQMVQDACCLPLQHPLVFRPPGRECPFTHMTSEGSDCKRGRFEQQDMQALVAISTGPVHVAGYEPVWQVFSDEAWRGSGCSWVDYGGDYQGILETAYKEAPDYILAYKPGKKYTYEVDLQKLTQTNTVTGVCRQIRRVLVPRPRHEGAVPLASHL